MQTLRDSGYRAFEGLKRSRAIGAIGIGVNERGCCSRRWSAMKATEDARPALRCRYNPKFGAVCRRLCRRR
jgi:hypothetical protein